MHRAHAIHIAFESALTLTALQISRKSLSPGRYLSRFIHPNIRAVGTRDIIRVSKRNFRQSFAVMDSCLRRGCKLDVRVSQSELSTANEIHRINRSSTMYGNFFERTIP